MTQFGQNVTDVPTLNSAQSPKAGVKSPSSLGVVAEVFGKASNLVLGIKEDRDKKKAEAVITDFMNKQTAIADSVDQGKYNSAFGRSMMRKNFVEYANNNPAIRKELIKMQKDIVGTAGIGNIITKDSEQERLTKEQNTVLVREGLVNPGSTAEEFEIARNNLTGSLEAKRKYDLQLQTINLEKARTGLGSSQIELLNKRESKAAYDYLAGVSTSGHNSFKASMEKLVGLAQSGEIDLGQAVAEMERQFNQISTEFAVPLSKLTSTEANALMKPFELTKEVSLKIATGELKGEAAKKAFDAAINLQKANAIQDREITKAAAISSIFGHDPTVIRLSTENSVARFMGINADNSTSETANVFVTDMKDREGFKAYTDSLNRAVNGEDTPEEIKAELLTHFRKIVKSTKDHEGFIKNVPKGGKALMDWIGTQGFLKATKSYPEAFGDLDGMRTIISEHYSNEVWGMVENGFKQGKFTIKHISDHTSVRGIRKFGLVEPKFTNISVNTADAIEYKVDANGTLTFVSNSTSKDVKREVKRLNEDLSPVISKTARAMAHLDGRNDYKNAAMEAMSEMLGKEGLVGGASDGEEELDLKDFRVVPDIEGGAGQLSFLIDKKEGGGEYDTLFGFSQRGGHQFGGVDVSKMTVGEASEFASPTGDYGKWVKSKVGRIATPMGRYQIVGKTLRGLIKSMDLDPDTPFNAETQDAMFRELVKRRIKGKKTMSAKIKGLRAEWEGFKHISDTELMAAIEEFESSEE